MILNHYLKQCWLIISEVKGNPYEQCLKSRYGHQQLKPSQNELIFIDHIEAETNGRHFPDIFKRIFVNKNIRISSNISLNFVPWDQITLLSPEPFTIPNNSLWIIGHFCYIRAAASHIT